MSFRRIPFQFTTTDPIEKQRELERRFGLPASRNMFVDVPNPLLTGAVPREMTSSNSPRLQHRVPIFIDGHDQPVHSSVDSTGSYPESKKPNVRVIPIEIEGAESRLTRQRTFSGPVGRADNLCERNHFIDNNTSQLKRSIDDLSRPTKVKNTDGARVHNIPIQFEGSNNAAKTTKVENVKKDSKVNESKVKFMKSPGKENKAIEEINKVQSKDQQKIEVENSLKKIEKVLEELKIYEAEVQEFSGTIKDKKYRYLDEMLTRCMINLDDVDTMGMENIRSARKNAVKKIQAQIDCLEIKANAVNASETTLIDNDQTQVSEDTTSVEISKENNDQQNEFELTESKEKLEKLDTEMIESETDDKQTNERIDVQQDDGQADVKDMRGGIECQLDVEMVEKPNSEDKSERPNESLLTVSEQSDNLQEVEMTEIGESSNVQDVSENNCDIEEVEMIEKDISPINADLSNVDNPEKATNEQIVNSQDVEMSEVQSSLEDAKKQVLEEIVSSHTEENEYNNLESKAGDVAGTISCNINEVSEDKQHEIDTKSENEPHISETNNVDN